MTLHSALTPSHAAHSALKLVDACKRPPTANIEEALVCGATALEQLISMNARDLRNIALTCAAAHLHTAAQLMPAGIVGQDPRALP